MHEIRATIPTDAAVEVVRIAASIGIKESTTSEVFIHGPNEIRTLFSVETSTPKAQALTQALINSPILSGRQWTLTSRELRAIVSHAPVHEVTQPIGEPVPDVVQDLWQLSHITWSYVWRALSGAVLLGTGIIDDNPIAIVASALFLPFLSQILAVGVGIWNRDTKLALHGVKAVGVSVGLAMLGGAIAAAAEGGPIIFHAFKGPLASFAISAAIGLTAGISSADDTGRRYLIGVAAAVQLAIFPVWFGAAAMLGVMDWHVVASHMMSFVINLGTILATGMTGYAFTRQRNASNSKTHVVS